MFDLDVSTINRVRRSCRTDNHWHIWQALRDGNWNSWARDLSLRIADCERLLLLEGSTILVGIPGQLGSSSKRPVHFTVPIPVYLKGNTWFPGMDRNLINLVSMDSVRKNWDVVRVKEDGLISVLNDEVQSVGALIGSNDFVGVRITICRRKYRDLETSYFVFGK